MVSVAVRECTFHTEGHGFYPCKGNISMVYDHNELLILNQMASDLADSALKTVLDNNIDILFGFFCCSFLNSVFHNIFPVDISWKSRIRLEQQLRLRIKY